MEAVIERVSDYLTRDPKATELNQLLDQKENQKVYIGGLCGSRDSFLLLSSFLQSKRPILVICSDKEEAAYFTDDLTQLMPNLKVHLLPDSFRRPLVFDEVDYFQIQQRVDAMHSYLSNAGNMVISYPEALFEHSAAPQSIEQSRIEFNTEDLIDLDEILIQLNELGFERVDFVYEPGQFSLRGGILDLFSFATDHPYRIELNDIVIESIRTFDPQTQLSIQNIKRFSIIPNFESENSTIVKQNILDCIPPESCIWIRDLNSCIESLNKSYESAIRQAEKMIHYEADRQIPLIAEKEYSSSDEFLEKLEKFKLVFFNERPDFSNDIKELMINSVAQPSFNKNFNLLIEEIRKLNEKKYPCFLLTNSAAQIERFHNIFEDLKAEVQYYPEVRSIREGFIDHDMKIACFTDHQIFSRFHGYRLKQGFSKDQSLSLKVLRELQPGDYVTHMDYGVGRFAGLEKLNFNGQLQEAVRLIYKNDDILYVSIHSLHKISKFVGQEGSEPGLSKLGSEHWKNLKARTKQKVKDIAKELIALYGKRKLSKGFAFHPDNYLQVELEASFMYEDTPDQAKATIEVKSDMEKPHPMDRLICGDVGFGKTEVAIRAAFKAVQDGKQVAILVPTTILALQHFRTFKERFQDFPVDVDYVSRFRSTKEKNQIIKSLQEGKLDILIGTVSLLNAKVKFKDLGLLIIDEEQKFGVASKEKLRQFKHNVDTLTLTATPIPRTLQFSLMAARDLSVIQTPPPNRQPIHTERRIFNDQLIQDAIMHEVYRGGQVFFVHNKVKSLADVAAMLKRLCPTVDIAEAHGQMEAEKLEKILIDFIDHKYDVLVCTNIIETGLDIPNANTIIINNAHNFGLSDLHQLRGRVGRSNRKAYCYLFAPPSSVLTMEARKRLKTIEEFSDLGSGFNVAMRDLDIRGAGNLLGGEQSGFIADIGYDAYQRILEEAILELKASEFKDLFKEEQGDHNPFLKDVTIDSDVEMMIPDEYVSNIQERLNLYQELDKLEDENAIDDYCTRLKDRFGELPKPVFELLNGLRLRWIARKLGFERVVLKKRKLQCYFISNPSSAFFESNEFNTLMSKLAHSGSGFLLKQKPTSLVAIAENIKDFDEAIQALNRLS